jgi:hypothetical protein
VMIVCEFVSDAVIDTCGVFSSHHGRRRCNVRALGPHAGGGIGGILCNKHSHFGGWRHK